MVNELYMNVNQQIFMVFFAIVWGTTTSVHGRWNMYPFALYKDISPQTGKRLLLSLGLMTLAPLIFFGFVMVQLDQYKEVEWTFLGTSKVLIHSVLPAFAVFGFYRLWVAIVELFPESFYRKKVEDQGIPLEIEPTLESLGLKDKEKVNKWGYMNFAIALIYIVVAFIASFVN